MTSCFEVCQLRQIYLDSFGIGRPEALRQTVDFEYTKTPRVLCFWMFLDSRNIQAKACSIDFELQFFVIFLRSPIP